VSGSGKKGQVMSASLNPEKLKKFLAVSNQQSDQLPKKMQTSENSINVVPCESDGSSKYNMNNS
jgi:hypothetical protein